MKSSKTAYIPNPHYGWGTERECLVYLTTGEPVGADTLKGHRPQPERRPGSAPMHYRTTVAGLGGAGGKAMAFCRDRFAVLATSERARVDCKACIIRMKKRGLLQ
jgi:hypothetical protein